MYLHIEVDDAIPEAWQSWESDPGWWVVEGIASPGHAANASVQ